MDELGTVDGGRLAGGPDIAPEDEERVDDLDVEAHDQTSSRWAPDLDVVDAARRWPPPDERRA